MGIKSWLINKLEKDVESSAKDMDLYTYSQDIEIITDNYINIHNKYHNNSLNKLIEEINNKNQELELHNVYTSNKLTSICFAILDQIVRHDNLQIKTCLNCGRYFNRVTDKTRYIVIYKMWIKVQLVGKKVRMNNIKEI